MTDKSGRELGPGDLVICFRNRKRLDEMEYAIVIAEGKVYNGEMTYTVNNNAYKCALTEPEIEIQNGLYEKYFKKTNIDRERKQRAKDIVKIGQKFINDGYTHIYLGKVKFTKTKFDGSLYQEPYVGYFYLKYNHKNKNYNMTSQLIVDSINNNNNLNITLLNRISNGYREIDVLTNKSKMSAVDELLDVCDVSNWDIGSKLSFKYSYNYNLTVERLK